MNNFGISNFYWYLRIIVAFLVKILPIFIVYLLLRKKRVKVSARGSMILAGISLKLVGYEPLHILINIEMNLNFIWFST